MNFPLIIVNSAYLVVIPVLIAHRVMYALPLHHLVLCLPVHVWMDITIMVLPNVPNVIIDVLLAPMVTLAFLVLQVLQREF